MTLKWCRAVVKNRLHQYISIHIYFILALVHIIDYPNASLLDIVKGPPPKLKIKNHFAPCGDFTPGTPFVTHYTYARQSYSPHRKVIAES